MDTATIYEHELAQGEKPEKACLRLHGWYPDTIREVDSGEDDIQAWMCFESAADADLWDKQK